MFELPSRSRLLWQAVASIFLMLWIGHGGRANGAVPLEAARQLIERTTFINVLRTDAEQASLLADRLPDVLPAELRSDLRRVLDRNIGYEGMEAAVVEEVAAKLGQAELDDSLRWWASGSGQAIRLSESRAYASLFAGSSFEGLNPTRAAPQEGNSDRALRALAKGRFASFAVSLLRSTDGARVCLSHQRINFRCAPKSASPVICWRGK